MSFRRVFTKSSRLRRNLVRSVNVGTSTSIIVSSSLALPSSWSARVGSVMYIENFAARAASLMKSPTSIESEYWKSLPDEDVLLKDKDSDGSRLGWGKDARMSRLTCDRGWEGCRSSTVGGWVLPSGKINLNKCDEVGDSLPGFRTVLVS